MMSDQSGDTTATLAKSPGGANFGLGLGLGLGLG
jgi:hypothetical protein